MNPKRTSPATDVADGRASEIAEFQGLYGAYHVSETLLQKVWMRAEFDLGRARLASGEALRVLHPGTWNRLAGPDFRGAKLQLGERVVVGDVEVHFHAEAWAQHGHQADPAYDEVVLHVVLFPPAPGFAPARTRSGREIPVLVLVDLLWHDLEEYASDEAVAALSGRDPLPLIEELLALPILERAATIRAAADRRWREKVHFAGRRIARLGWEQACHLTTLEVLGYRANRVAMVRVGEHFPWASWRTQAPTLDDLVAVASGWWSLRGVRPANLPRLRLAQYRAWMTRRPDWPKQLRELEIPSPPSGAGEMTPAALRKRVGLAGWRERMGSDLCGGELGGTRLDTWICNLLLPFRGALSPSAAEELWWQVWFPGDAPELLLRAVRQLAGPGLSATRTNGAVQGLLGLQLGRMRRTDGVRSMEITG